MKAINSWLTKAIIRPTRLAVSQEVAPLIKRIDLMSTDLAAMSEANRNLREEVKELLEFQMDSQNERAIRDTPYLVEEDGLAMSEAQSHEDRLESLEHKISKNYLDMILADYDFTDEIESAVDDRLDGSTVTIHL